MVLKVRISQEALAELSEIAEYSWTNFPATSRRFIQSLLDHIEMLERFPRLGSPVRGRPGIRKLSHTPLQIFYRLEESRALIEVVHIWHGERRPPENPPRPH